MPPRPAARPPVEPHDAAEQIMCNVFGNSTSAWPKGLCLQIVLALTAAVAAERAACSQMATDYGRQVPAGRMFADRIAAAIRARTA